MSTISKSAEEIKIVVLDALIANGTTHKNAFSVATALISAEIDGQSGHGISRVSTYIDQLHCGKVDGSAIPEVSYPKPAICRIDAKHGFSYPAMDLLVDELAPIAQKNGIAIGSVSNSHHFGQAGYHAERFAQQGLMTLIFTNSPKAMAPWGGSKGVFGTNPIAFGSPRQEKPPLIVDMSLSVAARGKVLLANAKDESIPEGWARDSNGNPTTDAGQALQGTMEPLGGAKGAALALMVEILAAGLTGGNFSFEASSFFDKEGGPPSIGHSVIAIDPIATAGPDFLVRIEILMSAILDQENTRIPGSKRLKNRSHADQHGLEVDQEIFEKIKTFIPIKNPISASRDNE